jgi:hypothetical protein
MDCCKSRELYINHNVLTDEYSIRCWNCRWTDEIIFTRVDIEKAEKRLSELNTFEFKELKKEIKEKKKINDLDKKFKFMFKKDKKSERKE